MPIRHPFGTLVPTRAFVSWPQKWFCLYTVILYYSSSVLFFGLYACPRPTNQKKMNKLCLPIKKTRYWNRVQNLQGRSTFFQNLCMLHECFCVLLFQSLYLAPLSSKQCISHIVEEPPSMRLVQGTKHHLFTVVRRVDPNRSDPGIGRKATTGPSSFSSLVTVPPTSSPKRPSQRKWFRRFLCRRRSSISCSSPTLRFGTSGTTTTTLPTSRGA